jgi:hypothetical protein
MRNPLAEVFGYPVADMSQVAINHRAGRLCPFHNSSGLRCTKNSVTDPLGVCSIVAGETLAITCPIRFRQNMQIVADAAKFFFPTGANYVTLTEVRLNDREGNSAGNIDLVLAALDEQGQITDFGAVEVQAVYITGNISNVFKAYMQAPESNINLEWPSKNYPKPDYLSSSRKRLAPQLIYKGGILHEWGKKVAVGVHSAFFAELPVLQETSVEEAEIAWLVYDLKQDSTSSQYKLELTKTVYTRFKEALDKITITGAGSVDDFLHSLQTRIAKGKIMGQPMQSGTPPDVEPLTTLADSTFDDSRSDETD